jgi:hypothetical protein
LHARQSATDISKPGLWVDVVHLVGDDARIHEGGPLAAVGRTGEEPRLAAKSGTTQGALGGIVGDADTTVVEEACEGVQRPSSSNMQLMPCAAAFGKPTRQDPRA